jgi:predicted membrane channel-forming protein YqfA (hemolysin III family)
MASRIAAIEKWAAVADISRCLHNFNGVLQVCAAFTNSSVFRLKKTWEKVSKTVYIYHVFIITLYFCSLVYHTECSIDSERTWLDKV